MVDKVISIEKLNSCLTIYKKISMDETVKQSFLTEYRLAMKQSNRKAEVAKVYDKYKDFTTHLTVAEALSLGVEMNLWIETDKIKLQ